MATIEETKTVTIEEIEYQHGTALVTKRTVTETRTVARHPHAQVHWRNPEPEQPGIGA